MTLTNLQRASVRWALLASLISDSHLSAAVVSINCRRVGVVTLITLPSARHTRSPHTNWPEAARRYQDRPRGYGLESREIRPRASNSCLSDGLGKSLSRKRGAPGSAEAVIISLAGQDVVVERVAVAGLRDRAIHIIIDVSRLPSHGGYAAAHHKPRLNALVGRSRASLYATLLTTPFGSSELMDLPR